MTSTILYHDAFEALKYIYLEDSWVLGINQDEKSISFEVEFVLTKSHELYSEPKKNEQYCYKKGQLILSECSVISLKPSGHPPSTDANGEKDFGNIDTFTKQDGKVELSGDWGNLLAKCNEVLVNFNHDELSS